MKRLPQDDAFDVLLETFGLGVNPSRAIENQEKRGQQALAQTDVLPRDMREFSREQVESLGIVFGEPVDDLFVAVTLPQGWKKVPSNHSMWTDLVDDKGRVRAHIFYKAAFYDRAAHMFLTRRYNTQTQPMRGWDSGKYDHHTDPQECVVTDSGTVIWKSDPLVPSETLEWFRVSAELAPLGRAWLAEHYPDWENVLAYWNDDAP